jgi:hypothetical protein
MREEKVLIRLLRQLTGLIEQEAESNPNFAEKLEAILAPLPTRTPITRTQRNKAEISDLPDIFAERKTRGEQEFEFWLGDLGTPILRALIKHHGFDPSKRSQKWKEPEKLARLLSDQLSARLSRGKSFLKPGAPSLSSGEPPNNEP